MIAAGLAAPATKELEEVHEIFTGWLKGKKAPTV